MADYTKEQIDAIIEENKRLKNAAKSPEDVTKEKAEQNELDQQQLKIMIAQNKALGEKFSAQQNSLKLLKLLNDQQQAAFGNAKSLEDLRAQARSEEDINQKKKLEADLAEAERLQNLIASLGEYTEGVERNTKAQDAALNENKSLFTDIASGMLPSVSTYHLCS